MDANTYLQDSGRTVAQGYHTEKLNNWELLEILDSYITNATLVEDCKKTLFYGKKISANLDVALTWNDRSPMPFPPEMAQDPVNKEIAHGILGICGESSELAEMLYNEMMGEGTIDRTKLVSEVGDVLWYIALILRNLGVNFEQAMAFNLQKLKTRYPEKFDEDLAINKDVDSENQEAEKTL